MSKRDSKGRFIKGSQKDYTGVKRGRLTFVEFSHVHITPTGRKKPYWRLKCDCGNEIVVSAYTVGNGTSSCGCLQKERASQAQTKHGESDTTLHVIWQNMKRRCYEVTNSKYKNYGARGIEVCDEWRNDYSAFAKWARSNGYKDGLSIERKDVDKNYEPSNCEWIKINDQSRNKTLTHYHKINGTTYQTMEDVAEAFDMSVKTLYSRYYRGDKNEELVRPVGERRFWKKTPR